MNCIIIDDDKLSRRVLEEFIKKTDFLDLTHSFESAVEAINALKKEEQIDLIFLDIEMPEMTGIDFLESFKNPPQVIIVSSKEKYAIDAFEYDVTDYLLKPVTFARFYKAVDKAQARLAKRSRKEKEVDTDSDEIFIKKNSSYVRLKYDDILWIEALENYVIVNTYNEKFTIHFTMKSIENKMPESKFKRVHRSYIVNINKINLIEDNTIVIKNHEGSKIIPIGKSYKDKLMGDINLIVK